MISTNSFISSIGYEHEATNTTILLPYIIFKLITPIRNKLLMLIRGDVHRIIYLSQTERIKLIPTY
jgi:hypothetical protein